MNILVLGASGGCGRWVCRLAAERGYRVTAAVRPSSRFEATTPSVRVERGEVLDQAFVSRLLEQSSGDGPTAVISCLGLRRRNPLNPWSPVISPPDLTTRVAELLAEHMPRQGVLRLVAISAAGVGDSLAGTHPLIRWMIARSNLGVLYRDLDSMERTLVESELDWMAVRPTTLIPGKADRSGGGGQRLWIVRPRPTGRRGRLDARSTGAPAVERAYAADRLAPRGAARGVGRRRGPSANRPPLVGLRAT